MLQKMIQAAARNGSYAEGSREMCESAELEISPKAIERAAHRIGAERVAQRTSATAAWQNLPLPEQQQSCPQPKAPDVAVVQFDCGRMLIREALEPDSPSDENTLSSDSGAAGTRAEEDSHFAERVVETALAVAVTCNLESGLDGIEDSESEIHADESRSKLWRDHKVGCLLTMQSEEREIDPCPEIPDSFLDVGRITKLVRQLGHSSGTVTTNDAEQPTTADKTPRDDIPKPVVTTILASRANSALFGAILAAAAWARGFAAARRKAFVADGAAMNWTLWQRFFSHYIPILDFIHGLQYVFAAAVAARSSAEGWAVYCRWIKAVWSGKVAEVLTELKQRQQELGLPPKDASESDPRKIVATTIHYFETHQSRMDYPRYRRLGLPIVSAYVESAVKQINRRVKGTEKFWSEIGAEAILQLRADYVSDTQPLKSFWQQRQQAATGQRCYNCAA